MGPPTMETRIQHTGQWPHFSENLNLVTGVYVPTLSVKRKTKHLIDAEIEYFADSSVSACCLNCYFIMFYVFDKVILQGKTI